MGRESVCVAIWKRQRSEGRALLEAEAIVFRGAFRVTLPHHRDHARVGEGGTAHTRERRRGTLALELGDEAERVGGEDHESSDPRGQARREGGRQVAVLGVDDAALVDELRGRGATVTVGRLDEDRDVVIVAMNRSTDLRRFVRLRDAIAPNGAIWTIRPKGVAEVSESIVRERALAAGLVDVKVARVSATHTAEKFVIPKARR